MEIGVGWGLQEQQLEWACDRRGLPGGGESESNGLQQGGGGGKEAGCVTRLCSPCILQTFGV